MGLVAFGGTVSWTSDVLAIFGGLNAALAWGLAVLLIAYLAVYPAVFSLTLTTAVARAGVGTGAGVIATASQRLCSTDDQPTPLSQPPPPRQ